MDQQDSCRRYPHLIDRPGLQDGPRHTLRRSLETPIHHMGAPEPHIQEESKSAELVRTRIDWKLKFGTPNRKSNSWTDPKAVTGYVHAESGNGTGPPSVLAIPARNRQGDVEIERCRRFTAEPATLFKPWEC